MNMKKGSGTRKAFDRALQALPITQHKLIWNLYIQWAKSFGVEETTIRVYRRFLMYDPQSREEFVTYLEAIGQYEEAAVQLSIILNDEHYVLSSGRTKHQLWLKLCNICSKHPQFVVNTIKVEDIIRSGISKFSDEVGMLWNSLADFYIRLGQFEKARDIYEEAITTVRTVRDFTIIFDEYVKVEESIVTAKLRLLEEAKASHDPDFSYDEDSIDVNMRLSRLEYLMDQRPILLNSVILRQNPHNVLEWHKRVKLFNDDFKKKIGVFAEAVEAVDPKMAVGRFSGLWLSYARAHEHNHGDVASCRTVFERASRINFKTVDELANVWCAWAEMEMRHEFYTEALRVMSVAVTQPVDSWARRKAQAAHMGKVVGADDGDNEAFEGATVADKLYKNVKVWSLYLDLEESLGSTESCRAAYDRVFELKVVTAQMALNYAAFLEENNFFEDSFTVYERAVALFEFPQVKKLWIVYLDKFTARYGGTKLERLRDLFEQSLLKIPATEAAEFYIKYAKAEQEYGSARHAMAVYDRAAKAVPPTQRLDMYRLYIQKVEQLFGATKTRAIYEAAIRDLDDDACKALCLEFVEMERRLGEIDRARAVLQYGSQFADPRRDANYWRKWHLFEEAHGNVDTFKEMLRVQRSVEASFAQVVYVALEVLFVSDISKNAHSDCIFGNQKHSCIHFYRCYISDISEKRILIVFLIIKSTHVSISIVVM
jgi:pre-mRNA-splicing factor SYF1